MSRRWLGPLSLVACGLWIVVTTTPVVAQVGSVVTVVEYYHAGMDHYFITSQPIEISLCDAGLQPCTGWVRTGKSFTTWAAGNSEVGTNIAKVCRLYNDSFAGKSTHFFALGAECDATLARFPDWQLESSEVFDANYPDQSGFCFQFYLTPLYRLYNNGMGGAPNHRFTTNYGTVQEMMAKGWTLETPSPDGYTGGVMCVPSVYGG